MKILTIGRGENCHIVYDNPLVSRQHAILKISSLGKMEIKDQSTNGTSINGVPMKKGRFCKVSRKDVITFAGVSQLDWKEVPDPAKPYKIICLCLLGIAIVLGAYFLFFGNGNGVTSGGATFTGPVDTTGFELPVPNPSKVRDSINVKVNEALKSMSSDQKRSDKAKIVQKDKLESSAREEQARRDSLAAVERQQKKAEEEKKQKDSLNSISLM